MSTTQKNPDIPIWKVARQLAKHHGSHVFPIAMPSKQPLTNHGHKDASNDPTTVVKMFREAYDNRPFDQEVGIGYVPGLSGSVVGDVDVKDGAGGDADMEDLVKKYGVDHTEDTPTSITPSGGRHHFWTHPDQGDIDNTKLAPAVDIRADAGYVILPPTAGYEWDIGFEGGWCERCAHSHPLLEEAPIFPDDFLKTLATKERPQGGITRIEDGPIPAGERYDKLFKLGSSMAFKGVSRPAVLAALLEENKTRCQPPHTESHIRKIVADAMTATDFVPPERKKSEKRRRTRTRPVDSRPLSQPTDDYRIPLIDVDTVETLSVDWLWEPYMAKGQLTLLSGISGVGKTWVELAFAEKASQMGVNTVIIAHENHVQYVLKPRWDNYRDRGDGKLYTIPVTDAGLVMLNPEGLVYIRRLIEDADAGLFIMDPIVRYYEGNMNYANEVRSAMGPLKELAEETALAVVATHHLNRGPATSFQERILGSGDFTGVVDLGLGVGEDTVSGDKAIFLFKSRINDKTGYSPQGFKVTGSGLEGTFEWLGDSTLTEARALASPGVAQSRAEESEEAIKDYMRDGGWVAVLDLDAAMLAAGYTSSSLKGAKNHLRDTGQLAFNAIRDVYGKVEAWQARLRWYEEEGDLGDTPQATDEETPDIEASVCPECSMGDGRHGTTCSNREKEEADNRLSRIERGEE